MGDDTPPEEFPEWYALVKAAKYLGVAPWDLMDQPMWWMVWGIEAWQAEVHAENEAHKRAAAKSKKGRR